LLLGVSAELIIGGMPPARLSEKTIELNFCTQFVYHCRLPVLWFGLTQKQEAKAGFDVWTAIRGRLLILQFKASNRTVHPGYRRFELHHDQLENLRKQVLFPRTVFYVFPLVGNMLELSKDSDVVRQSWLLDVAHLSSLGPPTKDDGNLRKNRRHHADVRPWAVTLHSEPVEIGLNRAATFAVEDITDAGIVSPSESFPDGFEQFWQLCTFLTPRSAAAVIPHHSRSDGH
jgi:hypothetical protein